MNWRHDLFIIFGCVLCAFSLSGGPQTKTRPMRILLMGEGILSGGAPYSLWQMLQDSGLAIYIFNECRSGHNAWEYLQFLKANYHRIQELHPDIIFIQIGLEDALRNPGRSTPSQYYNNTLSIVRTARTLFNGDGEPSVVLLGLLPLFSGNVGYPLDEGSKRRIRAELNPALIDLASREALTLVNMSNVEFGQSNSMADNVAQRIYHALMPYLGIHVSPTLKEIWESEI